MKVAFVFPLLCIGIARDMATAQSAGTFTATGNMTVARAAHTATLLSNGKVLITGGSSLTVRDAVSSAELYDPSSRTFTPAGNMTVPRTAHTATLLAEGRVLITGGYGDGFESSPLRNADLYDPSSGTFTATGDMITGGARRGVLLGNGKVLITGGPRAELYDPATGVFTATGSYARTSPEFVHTATLLPDGRVLIAGWSATCEPPELYDPVTGRFSPTGPLSDCDNVYSTGTVLPNGKVLFVGNVESNYVEAAEVYDPATGAFTALEGAPVAASSPATLLPDGKVLITGGVFIGGGGSEAAWLYDPATGKFASAGAMTTGRAGHTTTLLPNGTVLIAGGYGPRPPSVGLPTTEVPLLASAEVYSPPSPLPAPVLFSLSGDAQGQGAILHAGTARLVSASDPAVAGDALEIYLTGVADGVSFLRKSSSAGEWQRCCGLARLPAMWVSTR